jgi:transglutaminase-like putative cysteine protease
LADDERSVVTLLDHDGVEWSQVRQTRYWMYQRFEYHYPGVIRELYQRLVVFPTDQYGDQRLCTYGLRVSVPGATTRAEQDVFGNRVFFVYIPAADQTVTFEMDLVVERNLDPCGWPQITAADIQPYRVATALTTPNAAIETIAQQFSEQYADLEQRAAAISTWVSGAMRYGAGATDVNTTAAEALAIGQGLCQDYAHIMLAICHAAGLPARYISGHMLGEGGSHAWVEVLLADQQGGYRAIAFDPTNQRQTTPAYITVAIGRDYHDVSPTSGSYIAPYAGYLTTKKRAGLTHLEYRSA